MVRVRSNHHAHSVSHSLTHMSPAHTQYPTIGWRIPFLAFPSTHYQIGKGFPPSTLPLSPPTPDMTNERGGGEGKASGDFNSLNTKEAFQMSHTVEGGRQEGAKQPTLPQSLPLDKKTKK